MGDEWRPIDTAPKNGSRVLVVNWWRDMEVATSQPNGSFTVGDWNLEMNATHWMPLPDAPTDTKGQDDE